MLSWTDAYDDLMAGVIDPHAADTGDTLELYERGADIAAPRPTHTAIVAELLDEPPTPYNLAACVDELRAVVEALGAQIAELRKAHDLLVAVRAAMTVPGAAPLTLFDYRYCRLAFPEAEAERRMRFIHAFVTGEDDVAQYDCYAKGEPDVAAKVRGGR